MYQFSFNKTCYRLGCCRLRTIKEHNLFVDSCLKSKSKSRSVVDEWAQVIDSMDISKRSSLLFDPLIDVPNHSFNAPTQNMAFVDKGQWPKTSTM